MDPALLAIGGFALAALWFARGARAAPALPSGRRLTTYEVDQLARHIVTLGGYAGDVSPEMLVSMAWIESAFDPAAIGDNGGSHGLMQIRPSTAEDITARLGGTGYGGPLDLLDPALAMDYAARYLAWLRTWNGVRRSDAWIVQAYNGGPGTAAAGGNSMTARHLRRYQATAAALLNGQGLPNVASIA